MSEPLLVTREDGIATVVLNRPEKLNALNRAMWGALASTFSELDADQDLRCIVIRGAGERAFSPGADITEFEAERADRVRAHRYNQLVESAMGAISGCRHPTVALIHGICVGGGLEVAASCDLRIAGRSSTFGVPIKRLGLVMGYGELKALMALVGPAVTLEILLEGRVFGAEEAFAKRLLNRVVDDDKVEEEAYATARRIAEGAPLVARWHKAFVHRLLEGRPLSEAELEESLACYDTEDFRIGVRAFLEKRKPAFKGC